MIKIEHLRVEGWEAAIRGMRNPMNSWNKSDSFWDLTSVDDNYVIGDNDLSLMKNLVNSGSDHSKFMRMITVSMDITAPLYWWKEYDTYKVGTVANSCSTMHKIHAKEFTVDDFSCEQLNSMNRMILDDVIYALNVSRAKYVETKNKHEWQQLIQLLPSSYNQRRTVQLNYAVLRNIYHARRNHKLTEWHTLCDVIRTLPYSELITGEVSHNPCTT